MLRLCVVPLRKYILLVFRHCGTVGFSDDFRELAVMSSRLSLTDSIGRVAEEPGMESGSDRLIEQIVLLTLFLVSTAANSLALLVFCRRPGLRTISNR